MLRVETANSAQGVKLKFEGQFKGNDAQNTRVLLTSCPEGVALVVDLTDLTFIDPVGEAVLSFFGRRGAQFIAETSLTKFLSITPSYLYYSIPASGLDDLANRSGGFTRTVKEQQFRIDGTLMF
jgi:hypothetical protein